MQSVDFLVLPDLVQKHLEKSWQHIYIRTWCILAQVREHNSPSLVGYGIFFICCKLADSYSVIWLISKSISPVNRHVISLSFISTLQLNDHSNWKGNYMAILSADTEEHNSWCTGGKKVEDPCDFIAPTIQVIRGESVSALKFTTTSTRHRRRELFVYCYNLVTAFGHWC